MISHSIWPQQKYVVVLFVVILNVAIIECANAFKVCIDLGHGGAS